MADPVRQNTVVVKGYTQLLQAFARTDIEMKEGLRRTLIKVGEVVRADAAARFAHYDARSAAGYRTVVTSRSVSIRQSIVGKGIRPEYGALQMRKAFLPALDAKKTEVEGGFESLLDMIVAKNFG